MEKGNIIKLDTVAKYNELFGLETETLNPLVGVIDLNKASLHPDHYCINYGLYAIYLKDSHCGDILYGRRSYDYREGTIVTFAPGQIVETNSDSGVSTDVHGLLFHPDFIAGTALGRHIKEYSFFSYDIREALHINGHERETILECLVRIEAELNGGLDKQTRKIIVSNIELLLDYCMRFYERQFSTRQKAEKENIVRFENLLDEYLDSDEPQRIGLPTVKYFADKLSLSPNYFSDMISRQTGVNPSEHIRTKVIERVKEELLSGDKTTSQIAYMLGFQYPQHLSRMFKRMTGVTPNEFRTSSRDSR